jgi:hypothetical protein
MRRINLIYYHVFQNFLCCLLWVPKMADWVSRKQNLVSELVVKPIMPQHRQRYKYRLNLKVVLRKFIF